MSGLCALMRLYRMEALASRSRTDPAWEAVFGELSRGTKRLAWEYRGPVSGLDAEWRAIAWAAVKAGRRVRRSVN